MLLGGGCERSLVGESTSHANEKNMLARSQWVSEFIFRQICKNSLKQSRKNKNKSLLEILKTTSSLKKSPKKNFNKTKSRQLLSID